METESDPQDEYKEDVKQEQQEEVGFISQSAYMTLNRLNTQETEVDVESLAGTDVKLEFDTEEVTGWNELNEFYFS